MRDIKYCKRCGREISNVNEADWFRHISVKYCEQCREQSDREKTALRVHNLRQRKKEKDKFRDEQLELLEEENKLLRQKVVQMREQMDSAESILKILMEVKTPAELRKLVYKK